MLTFDAEKHIYRWNEKIVPSVTQILSRVGTRNEDGQWTSVAGGDWSHDKIASDFGNAFHAVAEYRVKKIDCEYDPAMEPWIRNLDLYLNQNEYIPLKDHYGELAERPLYSKLYGFAGKIDFPATFTRNRIVIVDWKTSTSFQNHWRIQLAAYAQLIKENLRMRSLPHTVTVMVSEKGYKSYWRTGMEVQSDFNKFNSIFNTFKIAA